MSKSYNEICDIGDKAIQAAYDVLNSSKLTKAEWQTAIEKITGHLYITHVSPEAHRPPLASLPEGR